MKKLKCHDCGKTLEKGDEYVLYQVVSEDFIKCKDCYKKDPVLEKFQKSGSLFPRGRLHPSG